MNIWESECGVVVIIVRGIGDKGERSTASEFTASGSAAGGSIAGAFSIPTRHIHQVIEMVHKKDVKNCIELLKYCLEEMNHYKWIHEIN